MLLWDTPRDVGRGGFGDVFPVFARLLIFITVDSVKTAGAGYPVSMLCRGEIISQKVLAIPKNDMDVTKYCQVAKLPNLLPPKYSFHYVLCQQPCLLSEVPCSQAACLRGAWWCCLKPCSISVLPTHFFLPVVGSDLEFGISCFSQVEGFFASQILSKRQGEMKNITA